MYKLLYITLLFIYCFANAKEEVINYFELQKQFKQEYRNMVNEHKNSYIDIVKKNKELYYKILEHKWGKKNVVFSGQKNTTYYSNNLNKRENIDYDKGTLTIEIISETKPSADDFITAIKKLKKTSVSENVKNELIFKDLNISLNKSYDKVNSKIVPIREIKTEEIKEKKLLNNKKIYFIQTPLVSDYIFNLAKLYYPSVKKIAKQYMVDESYILGIIHTESSFNFKAISPVPAYGLMQLVPKTAGLDAYETLTGKKTIPTQEYLFDPVKNIELGVVYINKIQNDYLKGIKNKEKLYLSTSISYNAGIGTLYKSFSKHKKKREIIKRINQTTLERLYEHYKDSRKFSHEARNYIDKVQKHAEMWKKSIQGIQ